jgi:SlyX protein
MDESRLADLESTVAFQEKTIEDLSDVICRQQAELDALMAQLEQLVIRLDQAEEGSSEGSHLPIEPPPNY